MQSTSATRPPGSMERPVRVLVVDDEPTARQLLAHWLRRMPGVEVHQASNGLDGLELILAQDPDLAVIDINMPVLNGLELIELIRSNPSCSRLPVVVASCVTETEQVSHAVSLGIWDYLVKPIAEAQNLSRVRRAVKAVQTRRLRDVGEATGSRVLVVDPDPDFRRFVAKALQPPLAVDTAETSHEGVAKALTKLPELVLVHEDLAAATQLALDHAAASGASCPAMRTLTTDPQKTGGQFLLRTYETDLLLSQALGTLARLAPTGSEAARLGSASLALAADRGLRRFLGSLSAEGVQSLHSNRPLGGGTAAWVRLTSPGGSPEVRFVIECRPQLGEKIVTAMLDEEAPSNPESRSSALRELVNTAGASLEGFSIGSENRFRRGYPQVGLAPPTESAKPAQTWVKTYRWRGEIFRTECSLFE